MSHRVSVGRDTYAMNRIGRHLTRILANALCWLVKTLWRAVEKTPMYRRQQIAQREAEDLAERQSRARTEARVSRVMDFARSLHLTQMSRIRSMRAYDDPSIAPYYKCKSRFFNEHYISAALSEDQLSEKLRDFLRSDSVVGEMRDDHLLLVSGRQSDFYERSLFRTGETEFVVVEWWHHDWDGPSTDRCKEYRDDFHWRRLSD